MMIRTKIMATLGPASNNSIVLKNMVEAGVDAVRINFSHGNNQQHMAMLDNIRRVETETGNPLALCADLCGPKIRVGELNGGAVVLETGKQIVIQKNNIVGSDERISTTLPQIVTDVRPGELLLLDDGKIKLAATAKPSHDELLCTVIHGGVLLKHKGINLPQTDLQLAALTDKDRNDLDWIAQHDFDYVALSFVRHPGDVRMLRDELAKRNCNADVIAKIEKPQAVDNIDAIISESDAVMVARGDLGVEMDFPSVPVAQKNIARKCRIAGKPCIIATEMLESMIHSPTPTRAEISDVANAVLDHVDAVMLSAESAIGKFPVETVRMMNETIRETQFCLTEKYDLFDLICHDSPRSEAVIAAILHIIRAETIKAVAVFTSRGFMPRILAKNNPPCPILALSDNLKTVRKMTLYYGVISCFSHAPEHTRNVLKIAADLARARHIADTGDHIIVITGRPIGEPGKTNTIVIHQID